MPLLVKWERPEGAAGSLAAWPRPDWRRRLATETSDGDWRRTWSAYLSAGLALGLLELALFVAASGLASPDTVTLLTLVVVPVLAAGLGFALVRGLLAVLRLLLALDLTVVPDLLAVLVLPFAGSPICARRVAACCASGAATPATWPITTRRTDLACPASSSALARSCSGFGSLVCNRVGSFETKCGARSRSCAGLGRFANCGLIWSAAARTVLTVLCTRSCPFRAAAMTWLCSSCPAAR